MRPGRVPAVVALAGAIVAAAIGLWACGGSSTVVALVAGAAITKALAERWLTVEASADPRAARDRPELEARARELAVTVQWTLEQARELGVSVSAASAKRETEELKLQLRAGVELRQMPRRAQLQHVLVSHQVGLVDQIRLVKLSMLEARIEQARVVKLEAGMRHAEVVRFYQRNRRLFEVPERRIVAVIETFKKATAETAKREIEAGKQFAEVARRRSVDPLARDGRALTFARKPSGTTLRRAIFLAKPHDLVGPLRVSIYYIFEVLRILPAYELPLSQVERQIVRRLATREAASLAKAQERKWVARTKYVSPTQTAFAAGAD